MADASQKMIQDKTISKRETVFISKATPSDDEFVLWLAPRLEAAGYKVFADILNLEPGDRWRKIVTNTLQNKAAKMLLCCSDSSLGKDGVQEEIGIALDLVKDLKDPRFIIPLRLKEFKKLFGIGELQYVDFLGSWGSGLRDLLKTLAVQNVPQSSDKITINPNWENYKRRFAIRIIDSPEVLTTNWVRISRVPDLIRYFQPLGPIDLSLMEFACNESKFPATVCSRGFFSFATPDEVEHGFTAVGKFELRSEHNLLEILERGSESPQISPKDARNLVSSMFRRSWESFCRTRGLYEYAFSSQSGFHATKDQIALGKRIAWGPRDQRRSSMLRNSAKGKAWQFGISATPYFRPFPHFKVKSRVLFAELAEKEAGAVIQDTDQQHNLRRRVCSVWRNKAWHGRLMAFFELLAEGTSQIQLPLSESCSLALDSSPMLVTAPVTTVLPDEMSDESEEQDPSTLGQFNGLGDDQ